MKQAEFTIEDIFGDSLELELENDGLKFEEPEEIKSPPKLVKVTKEGIVILDKDLMETVKKKQLSASMISGFQQCPADWFMSTFILPKIDHEEPIYFLRGHIFHETMEKFFAYPKEERDPKLLSRTAMEIIKTKYSDTLNDKETMLWVKEALQGYLETGFDYKNVEIAEITRDAKKGPQRGVELFVKGKLGNTSRQIVGFVDRIDRLPNGSLQIVDYKTGKKISPFDPQKPIDEKNDFSYWRQQLAYTMLLQQEGHYVSGAKLEFPIAKGEVVVDVQNEHLRKQVEKDFEAVDAALTKCIEDNLFPFKGHLFCKWCGMLSSDYQVSRFGKLNVSWEDVNRYVEFM